MGSHLFPQLDTATAVLLERSRRRLLTTEELDLVAATVPTLIKRYDLSGRCVYICPESERYTAKPPTWFLGRHLDDYEGYPEHFLRTIKESIEHVKATHEVNRFETSLEKPWGLVRRVHRHCPEFGANGELVSVLSLSVDETAKHNSVMTLERAVREQSHFLSMMAHELRNPLAAVLSGVEALDRKPSEEVGGRIRASIHRQVAHITRLIDDLLDTARLETGGLGYQRERVRLDECLALACQIVEPTFKSASQILEREFNHGDVVLKIDSCRISQAISNLLHNASKFSPAHSVVRIKTTRDVGCVTIDIIDQGLGIREDDRTAIFDRYRKGIDLVPTNGLGLGLHVARQIVRYHDGDLTLASSTENGSTFRVSLPTDNSGPLTEPPASKPEPCLSIASIPIIDDNAAGLEALRCLLELEGYSVAVAATAKEGEELFAQLLSDVVLLDLGLPDDHGHNVARRLTPLAESRGSIIIALTGWGSESDRKRSLEAGCHYHLTKPIRIEELARVVGEQKAKRSLADLG